MELSLNDAIVVELELLDHPLGLVLVDTCIMDGPMVHLTSSLSRSLVDGQVVQLNWNRHLVVWPASSGSWSYRLLYVSNGCCSLSLSLSFLSVLLS